VQPSAELTSQVLPKAPKIPNTKGHVDRARNISSVVANKLANPHKIKGKASFFFAKELRKITKNSL